MKYRCTICGYIYDEKKENIPFKDLPDTWKCPLCGASKSDFELVSEESIVKVSAPEAVDYEMKKLSVGELSSVCSNLARGCEKQYKNKEADLFRELADYLAAITANEKVANTTELSNLIMQDINENYPDVTQTAKNADDRGTQRICVWGEKVTRMLNSLIKRYNNEGDGFLENTEVWVCTVCGFVYVGDKAPQLCPVCKVPDWKFEKMERRHAV